MRRLNSPIFLTLAVLSAAPILGSCSSAPDHPVLDLAGDIPRHYSAKFAHEAPTIDGSLDDIVWRDAPWTANFVAVEGSATSRPRYQSRAKMLWNRQYLFLGIWMIEPNLKSIPVSSLGYDGLLTFVTRDAELGNYRTISLEPGSLLLDSHFVSGDSYMVSGNPSMIVGKVSLSGTLDTPGDADRGWWAEIAIPWSSLKSPEMATIPAAGNTVRVNFYRKGWAWSPYFQHNLNDTALWGKVELTR